MHVRRRIQYSSIIDFSRRKYNFDLFLTSCLNVSKIILLRTETKKTPTLPKKEDQHLKTVKKASSPLESTQKEKNDSSCPSSIPLKYANYERINSDKVCFFDVFLHCRYLYKNIMFHLWYRFLFMKTKSTILILIKGKKVCIFLMAALLLRYSNKISREVLVNPPFIGHPMIICFFCLLRITYRGEQMTEIKYLTRYHISISHRKLVLFLITAF